MIDPIKEELFSLAAAGRLLAIDGEGISPSTVWRWATNGRGPKRIKLETIRVGGRTCVSREALSRFLAALNPQSTAPAPTRTQSQRAKASSNAAAELRKIGI